VSKPRLLDLFCGAGGAAMGYHRAGFEVVGVDIAPQPRYPFEFIQADAIEYLSETMAVGFDVVHASPPCQAYSIMRNLPWLRGREYWNSVSPTRAALQCLDVPWVMENVSGAPLDGIFLCGTMFGLRQPDGGPEYRHRLFESTLFMLAPGHPKHHETVVAGPMLGRRADRLSGIGGAEGWCSRSLDNGGHGTKDRQVWGQSLGIDWMRNADLSQAIPPAYTEWIGRHFIATERVE
jgi:DNA (cytosine-5)-methyltransferase 1